MLCDSTFQVLENVLAGGEAKMPILKIWGTVAFPERLSKAVPERLPEVALKIALDFVFTVITLRLLCGWKDCPEPFLFLSKF